MRADEALIYDENVCYRAGRWPSSVLETDGLAAAAASAND